MNMNTTFTIYMCVYICTYVFAYICICMYLCITDIFYILSTCNAIYILHIYYLYNADDYILLT